MIDEPRDQQPRDGPRRWVRVIRRKLIALRQIPEIDQFVKPFTDGYNNDGYVNSPDLGDGGIQTLGLRDKVKKANSAPG